MDKTLLAELDDEISQNIIKQAQHVLLPAHTTIFHQGDGCQNYLLVQEGSIKVFTRAENGREITLYRVKKNESCILTTSCLLADKTYPAEGVTETPVEAIVISAKIFNHGLAQSKAFRSLVFNNYSQRLADVITLVSEVSFNRIDMRLATFLTKLSRPINITHQVLAIELGTAREVISRQLKNFESNGWLKLHRGKIEVLDHNALNKFAGKKIA